MNKTGIVPPLRLCFFMWLTYSVELVLNIDLGGFGISPQKTYGLIGIFAAPLLHGSFNHLIGNTVPLLILGSTLYYFYSKLASKVFSYSYFFTNILVWLLARGEHVHIGASGLVYAIASFLVFFGLFRKNFKSVLISVIVLSIYGGMAYGILPQNDGVSWESHLFGAIVGFCTAFIFGRKYSKTKV